VLYYALSRLFPGEIKDLRSIVAAVGLVLAIPVAIVFARVLDNRKVYFTVSAGGYTVGTMFWVLATIAFAIGGTSGANKLRFSGNYSSRHCSVHLVASRGL